MRSHSSLLALAVVGVAGLASPGHAAEPRDIGKAVEIQNDVTAAQASDARRRLAKQSPVREQEVLEAAVNSRGEFILADDTKLVLGPKARLVLDEFVYDPNQRAGNKVAVNFAKGAFRFISGLSGSQAYEIKTPAATIGIRGTILDGFVDDVGRMVLLLHPHPPGAPPDYVEVCSNRLPRTCEPLRSRCHLVYVTETGRVLPERSTWDGSLLPGVDVRTAFPFLERRLVVDPTIRCRYADLYTPEPLLKKALAPAPMSPPPLPPPPPPLTLPIPLIATVITIPLVLMEDDDNDKPASP